MNNPDLNDLTLAIGSLTEKLDRIEQTLENLRQQVENVKTSQYYYHHHYLPAYPQQPVYPIPMPWCKEDGTGNPHTGVIGVPGITYWGGVAPGNMPGATTCGNRPEF